MAKPAAVTRKPKTMAARKAKFLKALATSCNVSKARRAAGIATSTLYNHRRRLPAFAAQWGAATAEALHDLEETLIERAKRGVEWPVYFRGEQVGSVRSYSDALAMFLPKAKRPEIYARSIENTALPVEDMTQEGSAGRGDAADRADCRRGSSTDADATRPRSGERCDAPDVARYSDAMCVLALAWKAHPRWWLVAAGNRDELHARGALPLAEWDTPAGVIAGRDAVGGGTWLGVSEAGRFAVVTNLRGFGAADPGKASRGALVTDMLAGANAGAIDLDAFNPFNLIAIKGERATYCTNRPAAVCMDVLPGMHGLSNGVHDELWLKTRQLQGAVAAWLAAGEAAIEPLFAALRDERPPVDEIAAQDKREPITSPVFIRNPVYGTRCSTVVTVDTEGDGLIAERRFDAAGGVTGETRLAFRWS